MISLVSPVKGVPHHSNVSVGGSATLLVAANVNRKTLVIQNNGTGAVFIGDSSVATSGSTAGFQLASGNTFVDNATNTDWWAIASSTQTVHIIEVT